MSASSSKLAIRRAPAATAPPTSTKPKVHRFTYGIDPGLQGTGWAEFVDGTLTRAGVLTTPHACAKNDWWLRAADLSQRFIALIRPELHPMNVRVYCEMPHHFGSLGSEMGWKTGDLQRLTYLVGCLSGFVLGANVAWTFIPVLVRDWKGQLPKDVVTRRIQKQLGAEYCAKIGVESHAWDAVGIALYGLGRF